MPLTPEEERKLEEYERQERIKAGLVPVAKSPLPSGDDETSRAGAVIGGAATSAGSLAGYAGGLGLAGLLGLSGPPGWIVGLLGAVGAGYGTEKLKEKLAESYEPVRGVVESEREHPIYSIAGGVAVQGPLAAKSLFGKTGTLGALKAARLAGPEAVRKVAMQEATTAALGAGFGGVGSAGLQGVMGLIQGRGFTESISPWAVAGDVVLGATTPHGFQTQAEQLGRTQQMLGFAAKGMEEGVTGAAGKAFKFGGEYERLGGQPVRFEETTPGQRLPVIGAGSGKVVIDPFGRNFLDVATEAKQSLAATYGEKAKPVLEARENAAGAGTRAQEVLEEWVLEIWGDTHFRWMPKVLREKLGVKEPITGDVADNFAEYEMARMVAEATPRRGAKFEEQMNAAIERPAKEAEAHQKRLDRVFGQKQKLVVDALESLRRVQEQVGKVGDRALTEAERRVVEQNFRELNTEIRLGLSLDKPLARLEDLKVKMEREGHKVLDVAERAQAETIQTELLTEVLVEAENIALSRKQEKRFAQLRNKMTRILAQPIVGLDDVNERIAALKTDDIRGLLEAAQAKVLAPHRAATAKAMERGVKTVSDLNAKLEQIASLESRRRAGTGSAMQRQHVQSSATLQRKLAEKVANIRATLGAKELKSPITVEQAAGIIARHEADPAWGQIFKERHTMKMAALDALNREAAKGGVLTDDLANVLAHYDAYELRNFIQHMTAGNRTLKTTGGKVITVNDSGIKQLDEGSIRALGMNSQEKFEWMVRNVQDRIFNNRAQQELAKLAKETPDSEFLRLANADDMKFIEGSEAKKSMDLPNLPGDKMFLQARVRGEPIYMVADKRWAQHWIQMDPLIESQLAWHMGMWSGAKAVRMMATGVNPGFWLTNLPRDFLHNWLATGLWTNGPVSKRVPLIGMLQEAGDYWATIPEIAPELTKFVGVRSEGLREQAIKAGLGMGGLSRGSRSFGGIPELKAVGDMMGLIGDRVEMWSRLAMFRRAMKQLQPMVNRKEMSLAQAQQSAANQARKALNFSQNGSYVKAADTVMPYLAPSIAGTRDLWRGLRGQGLGMATWKLAQLSSLAGGLYLANRIHNKEAWDSISEYEKLNNFIFTTPFYSTDKETGKKKWRYWRIAMDQSQRPIGALIIAMMQRAIDGEVPSRAWFNVIRGLQQAIPLAGDLAIMPPLLKALAGVTVKDGGYDFFRDEKLWPGKPVEAQDEIRQFTTPLAIDLGRSTGTSPVKWDYFAQTMWTSNIWTALVGGMWKGATENLPPDVAEEMNNWGAKAFDKQIVQRVYRETRPLGGIGGVFRENRGLERGYNSARDDVKRHLKTGDYEKAKAALERWNQKAVPILEREQKELEAAGQEIEAGFMLRYTFQESEVKQLIRELGQEAETGRVDRRKIYEAKRGLGLRGLIETTPRPKGRESERKKPEFFGVRPR